MKKKRMYLDDMGGARMSVLEDEVSSTLLLNGAKGHGVLVFEPKVSVMAFSQNTREEVRCLGNVSGCLSAERGSHQQSYLCLKKRRAAKSGGDGADNGVGALLQEDKSNSAGMCGTKAGQNDEEEERV